MIEYSSPATPFEIRAPKDFQDLRLSISVFRRVHRTVCRNKDQIIFNYELRKTIIERANHVKDLAIILDSQLPYRQHIAYVVDKASRSLAVVFRMAKTSSDVYCFKSLYCCFARPTWVPFSLEPIPQQRCGTIRIHSASLSLARISEAALKWPLPVTKLRKLLLSDKPWPFAS